jgi:transcriptional regulator with XRE-family HTH domain
MNSQEPLDKEQFAKRLGERVRFLREKKGLSIREFEKFEGSISRQALSNLENGEGMPTAFTLYKIAWVIGVRVEDFFKDLS